MWSAWEQRGDAPGLLARGRTEGDLGAGEGKLREHPRHPRVGAAKEALAKVKMRTRVSVLVPRECA